MVRNAHLTSDLKNPPLTVGSLISFAKSVNSQHNYDYNFMRITLFYDHHKYIMSQG